MYLPAGTATSQPALGTSSLLGEQGKNVRFVKLEALDAVGRELEPEDIDDGHGRALFHKWTAEPPGALKALGAAVHMMLVEMRPAPLSAKCGLPAAATRL